MPDILIRLSMDDVRIILSSLMDRETMIKSALKIGCDKDICNDGITQVRDLIDRLLDDYHTMKDLCLDDY